MDPFSALSLTCAVLQVVDFGTKLVGTSLEVYKSTEGAPGEILEIEALASHAGGLSAKLTSLRTTGSASMGRNQGRDQEEDELRKLAIRSGSLADEIVVLLSGLKGQPHSSWKAARTALLLKWNEGKIKSLQERLDAVKSEIWLHILCMMSIEQTSMSTMIRRVSRRCEQLELQNREVLVATDAANRQTSRILEILSSDIRTSRPGQPGTDAESGVTYSTIIRFLKELSKLQDGHKASETVQDLFKQLQNSSIDVSEFESTSGQPKGDYSAIFSKLAPACWRFVAHYTDDMSEALHQMDVLRRQTLVLESLQDTEMLRREIAITEAFGSTFAWAFDPGVSLLPSWLKAGSGTFWVSGKPGSGKSTLMKVIAVTRLEHTVEMLNAWAGSKDLIVLKHFFWSSGTTGQSSYRGLLLAFVYQALQQAPRLIPQACPSRWSVTDDFVGPGSLLPWTEAELLNTLTRIVDENVSTAVFCFFIDGLDEFAGDHSALLGDLIECLGTRDNTKFCVSSRPYNPFEKALGGVSKNQLQLELLNHTDIDMFIKGRLERNSMFQTLANADPRAEDLTLEIRNRAHGVFLWVHLIVQDLIDGLGEEDSVTTLRKRLDLLPETLEKYFEHIIVRVGHVYHGYTAKCLLLANVAHEPLPVTAFAFLYEEDEDPSFLKKLPVQPISREEMRRNRVLVARKISSWCKGLLEIRDTDIANTWEPLRRSRVDFLHLSVKDFLETAYMQHFLREHAGSDFQPEAKLAQLFLAMAKVVDVRGLDDEMRAFNYMADEAVYFAMAHDNNARLSDPKLHPCVKKELDEIKRSLERGRSSLSLSGLLQVPDKDEGRSRSSSAGSRRKRLSLNTFFRKLREY